MFLLPSALPLAETAIAARVPAAIAAAPETDAIAQNRQVPSSLCTGQVSMVTHGLSIYADAVGMLHLHR